MEPMVRNSGVRRRIWPEGRFPRATILELDRCGHIIDRWDDWNEMAGHAHGIVIDPATGLRWGGSDPRSDGAAIGY